MTPTDQPIFVDLFAGGGGASMGIFLATGRHPDVAVNHDPKAIAMHKANHPYTMHVCQDIWTCPPRWACKGRTVALLHASPDCTHFSKAKGSAPRRDQKRRDLAWVIVKWCQEVRPLVVTMENVEEFTGWGPLDREGRPIASQAGQTFRAFINSLRRLGYAVQWRELRACDYGAPTIRKRLFLVARCDGRRIKWPRPTHGDPKSPAVKSGKLAPWRTAAECIDFTLPCPSIFERARPLAEATLHRIAEGIQRYVVQAEQPFIVNFTHGGRLEDISAPIKTITAAHRGEKGFVEPYLVGLDQAGARSAKWPVEAPLSTVITKAKHGLVSPLLVGAGGPVYAGKPVPADRPMGTLMTENHTALVAPVLVTNTSGHAPARADEPVATLTTGQQQILAAAGLLKHYGGVVGQDLDKPIGTVTTVDHHSLMAVHVQRDFGNSVGHAADEPCGTVTAGGGGKSGLVTSHLVKLRGTCKHGQPVDEPAPTTTSGGTHVGEVRAQCLIKYYGQGVGQPVQAPAATITSRDRMAVVEAREIGGHAAEVRELLRWHRRSKHIWGFRPDDFDGLLAEAFLGEVVIYGELYTIADIGMRMLQPRELYLAQGFPRSYIIGDDPAQGLSLTKAEQVRMCGNSVSPPVAAAVVDANVDIGFVPVRGPQALPLLAGEGGA